MPPKRPRVGGLENSAGKRSRASQNLNNSSSRRRSSSRSSSKQRNASSSSRRSKIAATFTPPFAKDVPLGPPAAAPTLAEASEGAALATAKVKVSRPRPRADEKQYLAKLYWQWFNEASVEKSDEENISAKDRLAKLHALIQAAPQDKIRLELKENLPAFANKGGALKKEDSWLNTSPWKSREYNPLTPQPVGPSPSSSSRAKSKAPAAVKLNFVPRGSGGKTKKGLAYGTTPKGGRPSAANEAKNAAKKAPADRRVLAGKAAFNLSKLALAANGYGKSSAQVKRDPLAPVTMYVTAATRH